MTVTAAQAGSTYRLLTAGIRVQRGAGNPDLVATRPRNSRTGPFTDSEAKPTLVTFAEGDQADIEFLLRIGAIAPHSPTAATDKSTVRRSRRHG